MRAIGLTKPSGAVKAKGSLSARGRIRKAHSRDFQLTSLHWEYAEHKCWDPKDGESTSAGWNLENQAEGYGGVASARTHINCEPGWSRGGCRSWW